MLQCVCCSVCVAVCVALCVAVYVCHVYTRDMHIPYYIHRFLIYTQISYGYMYVMRIHVICICVNGCYVYRYVILDTWYVYMYTYVCPTCVCHMHTNPYVMCIGMSYIRYVVCVHAAQGWNNCTRISHERVASRFLVLPGSESTITEITE